MTSPRTMAEAIKALVDAAPPLTPAQRDRLALLLRPGNGSTQKAA